jgi:hypothetical protein
MTPEHRPTNQRPAGSESSQSNHKKSLSSSPIKAIGAGSPICNADSQKTPVIAFKRGEWNIAKV